MASSREIAIIIPNCSRHFSGVTAAATAVIPHQLNELTFAQTGHPLPLAIPRLSWRELWQLTARPLPDGSPRVWHARRNIEMLAGILLRDLGRRKLRLLFTSVAQRYHSAWTRFLYRRMDAIISTSPRSASYLFAPVKAIVPHGVDTELFHPATDRARLWAESGLPGRYGIGIFGRVRPQKGLEEFVDALTVVLPRHPDWSAVIVGETTPQFAPFAARLRTKLREQALDKRVLWTGKIPAAEVRLWFQRVALVAAVSRNEGFGLTCLEAMSSGAAVVATRTGAFDMVIRDGVDGLLIPCRSSAALATALEQLLAAPARLAEMGIQARQRVCDAYRIQNEAAGLNAVYRDLLAKK